MLNVPEYQNGVKVEVRRQALNTKRRIQEEMPVDTGRARASWGNPVPMPPAEPDDGVWREEDGGLTVVQGSKVLYIEYLNEGHSQQAPAGFIDAAEADAIRELEDTMLAMMVRLF